MCLETKYQFNDSSETIENQFWEKFEKPFVAVGRCGKGEE